MIAAEHAALVLRNSRLGRARARLLCRTALGGAVSVGIIGTAQAGPIGGVVAGGQVTIDTQGSHTQITQGSNRGVIEWQDFSIGSGESVTFAQPGRSSVTLNKVMTQVPTEIAGQLTANGQVWIVNPNGVFVNKGADINVGGMLATTAKIDNQAFQDGGSSFSDAPEGSKVSNAGDITAEGGSVVLVAPIVENSGTITAQGGDVALGAGQAVAVDFHGDGLTRFEIEAAPGAKLTNTGTISAQGGAVYLSAASTNAVQQSVVSIGGKVEATRVENRGGTIVISGGETGVTEVTGTLQASQTTGVGGDIAVTGDMVAVRGTAVIEAKGATGGGQVRIGADTRGAAIAAPVVARKGAPADAPLPRARRTLVEAGAKIAADAGAAGDGGKVVVWGTEAVGFSGAISVRGGDAAGNGGFVEISGDALAADGAVDLGADFGQAGQLLLDPNNITIVAASGTPTNDASILFADAGNGNLEVLASFIAAQAGLVVLEARNDITINAAVGNGTSTFSLTLSAANNIVINEDVITTGDLSFTADADASGGGGAAPNGAGAISFGADDSLTAANITLVSADAISGIDLAATGNVAITAGSVALNSGADVSLDGVSVGGNLSVDVVGDLTQGAQGVVVVGTTEIAAVQLAADSFNVTLNDDSNAFGGAVSVTANDIDLRDGVGGIVLGDIEAQDDLIVRANGSITDNDPVAAGTGIDVTDTTNLQSIGTADITLDATVHDFGGTVTIVDPGADDVNGVTISDTNALSLGGFVADAAVVLTSGALLTVGAIDTPGTVTLQGTNIAVNGDINNASLTTIRNTAGGVGLGGATVDGFNLSDAEADRINTDLTIEAAGDIDVNGLTFDQDLDLDADAGIAFITTASTLTATLGAVAGSDISQTVQLQVSGAFTGSTTGGDITLATATNTFGSFAATAQNAGVAANVSVADSGALELGAISAADLTVSTGGAITQTAATGITATGTASITTTADAVTLTQTTNNFASVDVDTGAGAVVQVTDSSDLVVAGLVATDATLIAGGTVDGDGTAVQVSGTLSVNSDGAVSFNNAGNQIGTFAANTDAAGVVADVTVRDSAGTLVLGAINAEDVSVTAVGAVTQSGATTATGTVQVTTEAAITLDNTGNLFATVLADTDANNSGNKSNVSLRDSAGGLVLGPIDAADLGVTAVGTVTQSGAAVASGTTTVATEGAITLTDAGNQFAVVAADSNANGVGAAAAVSITDTAGTLQLGAVDASSLTVSAAGSVTQTGATALVVTGLVDVTTTAGNVTLEEANNVGSFAADATAAGTVSFVNIDGIEVGDVVAGSFSMLADSGDLAQVDGTSIQATGLVTLIATDGAVTLRDISADSLVAFAGGDSLTQVAGTALSVTTDADFTSIGGDVVLANIGNDLPDVGSGGQVDVTATGGAVSLTDLDTIALGSVVADSLRVTADDFQNLNFAGLDLANGQLALFDVTDGDIVISDTTLAAVFTDPVTAITDLTVGTGGAIESQGFAQAGLTLTLDAGGTVRFTTAQTAVDTLVVAGAGTITQDAAGTIASGTATDLTATGAITLEEANDFGTLSANGATITVNDTGALALGAITATGDLSVTAGGAISDTGGQAVTVAGDTTLTATGFDILLDNAALHDFDSDDSGDTVSADGANVTLVDEDTILLGAVTATGNLGVTAGASIADSGAGVTVTGTTDLDAVQTILLDDANNDFGGAVTAEGSSINLRDSDDITLGAIDTTGTLTVRAGSIVQSAGTAVLADDGFLISTAGVTLANADNDFTGTVAIQGTDVSLRDTNSVQLGEVNASSLTVQADAAITDANAVVAGAGIEVTGTTTLTGGAAVTLNDAVNDFGGAVSASGTNIALRDANALTGARIDASGTLTLQAGTTLAQIVTGVVGGDIDVVGTSDLVAGTTITLDSVANNFGGAVDASGSTISLRDRNTLTLGQIDATGDLTARSVGQLADSGAGVEVDGATTLLSDAAVTVDDLTNDLVGAVSASGTDVDLATSGNLTLGAVTASGNLGLQAGGTVADSGAGIAVTGTTTVTATGDDVTLDDAANAFGGAVSVTGADVAITDGASALQLGAVTATGTLAVVSGGALTDSDGQTIAVTGATTLTATGFDITLDTVTHDFTGAVTADGLGITLADANDLTLGAVTATGDLIVDAVGDLADSGLGLTVTGTSDLTAGGTVTLDDATNAFGGAVSASGDAISLADADDLTLDAIDSRGALTLVAVGAISDSAGDVLADGATTLQAGGDITLDNATNNFAGEVDATGATISLGDADDLQLGAVAATGDLIANAAGAITDTDGDQISVGGASTLTAGAAITLDNDDLHDFTGAVDFTGTTVTLEEANQLVLGAGTADTLVVTANDLDITGAVVVGGGTGVVRIANDQGEIGLGDAVGAADAGQAPDFTFDSADAANLDAGTVTFASGDGIRSNNFDSGGGIDVVVLQSPSVTFTAAGGTDVFAGDLTLQGPVAVTQGAGSLTVGGALTVANGTGGVALGETANDFQGLVTLDASNIALGDANDLTLGEIDATGNFSVDVGGSLTDSGAAVVGDGIDIAGTTSLTAGGPILVDDVVNDFVGQVDIAGDDVTLTDRGGLVLGSVQATGDLVLRAGGAIVDTTGLSIVVTGLTDLIAQSGVNLFDIDLDNLNVGAGAHDFGGAVSVQGTAVTLNDLNALALGSVSASSLEVTASSIADTGLGLAVTGNSVLTAAGNIIVDDAINNFGGTVAADGVDVSLADSTQLDLAQIAASGDFTALSGAAIVDTGAGVAVGGDASLTAAAGADVTLAGGTNDFTGAVNATGDDITLNDVNAIVVGEINATGNLVVTAGQGISDTDAVAAGDGIEVAGNTTLTAGADIVLDDAVNTFGGTVAADGAAISLVDTDDLILAEIDATGDLTLAAGGAVADTGAGVTVGGATAITAGAEITLDDAINDFTGAVDADGTDVTLADANDLVLGDIEASGTLGASAGGDILDTGAAAAGTGIDVVSLTALTAGGDIVLGGLAHDFGDAVSASGGAITLADANDLTLGTVQAGAGLTVDVAGSLSQNGAGVTVAGASDLVAGGDITLTTVTNDFQNQVAADAGNIALVDANDLELGLVAATGTLDAQAVTGSLTQTADGVVVAGDTGLIAGGDIVLGQAINEFVGAVDADGATVTLGDATDLTLGTVTATGDLVATAGGAISDTAGAAITVTGATTLTATGSDITVANGLHDFDADGSGDRLDADGATITLSDLTALALGTVTATGDLTLATGAGLQFGLTDVGGDLVATAGAAITDTDAQTITVAGASTLTATGADITLDTATHDFDDDATGDTLTATGANITLRDASGLVLGAVAASGNLDLGTGGDLTQDGSGIAVAGTTVVDATGFDVTLQTASNSFGDRVDLDGVDLALTATGPLVLGTVTATGGLDLAATGAISDTAGAAITVTGATTLTATGFDILLDTAGTHDFDSDGSGDTVSAEGANITLIDRTDIVLGTVDASGNLIVTAEAGAIGDSAALVAVDGATTLTAQGDITLDNLGNDFVGAVDAAGAAITLADANDLTLGAVQAGAGLTVDVAGGLSQNGAGIIAAGPTDLAAGGDITLTTVTNDFQNQVAADGVNINLVDANDLELGLVAATGTLDAQAVTGSLTQTADGVVVAGDTGLIAGGDIVLGQATNDFGGAVDAAGGAITLADADDLTLGNVDARAGLTVTTGGTLLQTADGLDVAGDAFFNANNGLNDILLDTDSNILRGTIRYIGQDVVIDLTQGAAVFGVGYALGDATLTNRDAAGTINLTQRLFTEGNLTVDAGGNIILAGTGLDAGQPSVNGVAITGLDAAVVNSANFARTLLLSGGGIALISQNGTLVPLASGILRAAQSFQSNVTVGGTAINVAAVRNGDPTLAAQAAAGDAINIDLAQAFQLVGGAVIDQPFTLDTGAGSASRIRFDRGILAIGDQSFLDKVDGVGFNPFVAGNTDLRSEQQLFLVTGDLILTAGTDLPSIHIANTTVAANQGGGTRVVGTTFLEGAFDKLSLFGSFNGFEGTSAAVAGFAVGPAGFTANPNLTANGCVILTVGNCTPLGLIPLRFEFNNGDLLAVRFIDPAEDEDDPFTNRGDEEDWQ